MSDDGALAHNPNWPSRNSVNRVTGIHAQGDTKLDLFFLDSIDCVISAEVHGHRELIRSTLVYPRRALVTGRGTTMFFYISLRIAFRYDMTPAVEAFASIGNGGGKA